MPMASVAEAIDAWMQSERVRGAAFALNEPVQIVAGHYSGRSGSVISLIRLQPTTAYTVELGSGEDVEIEETSLLGLSAVADARAFASLQRWYSRQCDGDWEHSFGVRIDTLDNPGWTVTIDLEGTGLENRTFDGIAEDIDGPSWIRCHAGSGKFEAACSPGMLSNVVARFLIWAESAEPA
jgi:hypothetical protein